MIRFSVVIPTRNRARTLPYTLRTCLAQSFPDLEIVVSDNASVDGTADVVARFEDARLRYVKTDRALCISDSWEFAVSQARGEYVILIGSDDGLIPEILPMLDDLLACLRVRALRWNRVYYTWPDAVFGPQAGHIQVPVLGSSLELDGQTTIREVANRRMDYTLLPMLYTSVIHRSLIQELRQRTGRVFAAASPDIYSGFAFAYLLDHYYSLGIPVSINGGSGDSLGFNAGQDGCRKPDVVAEWERAQKAGFRPHPRVSDTTEGMPLWIADAFETAKDHLFPERSDLAIDGQRPRHSTNPAFDGRVIEMDARIYDVTDVYGAAQLARSVLETCSVLTPVVKREAAHV